MSSRAHTDHLRPSCSGSDSGRHRRSFPGGSVRLLPFAGAACPLQMPLACRPYEELHMALSALECSPGLSCSIVTPAFCVSACLPSLPLLSSLPPSPLLFPSLSPFPPSLPQQLLGLNSVLDPTPCFGETVLIKNGPSLRPRGLSLRSASILLVPTPLFL